MSSFVFEYGIICILFFTIRIIHPKALIMIVEVSLSFFLLRKIEKEYLQSTTNTNGKVFTHPIGKIIMITSGNQILHEIASLEINIYTDL